MDNRVPLNKRQTALVNILGSCFQMTEQLPFPLNTKYKNRLSDLLVKFELDLVHRLHDLDIDMAPWDDHTIEATTAKPLTP